MSEPTYSPHPSAGRVPYQPTGLTAFYGAPNYNPPHGSATQIGSTAALVPGATGPPGLISQRFLPIMGQQPSPVRLSSVVMPPTDYWLVNVKCAFDPVGYQAGGWIYFACNNYLKTDIPCFSTYRAADTPSSYAGGSYAGSSYEASPVGGYLPSPPSGSPPWPVDAAREIWNGVAGEGTGPEGAAAFYYGMANLWGPGSGWVGPAGMFWWSDLPPLGPGGNPNPPPPWVPLGFDTNMSFDFSPNAINGGDQLVDMRYPVIGCYFASCNASVPPLDPVGPGTITPSGNPLPILPLAGEVTLYNNTTAWVWPLNWTLTDTKFFSGGVGWGGEWTAYYCTTAFYGYADLTAVREPGTYSYSRQLPGGGLVAIG